MQLTLWTYEGPPHIGAMRIATAMRGLHYVLHAPQGDTYADLLFTMIERRQQRPPVTYTTFQARDLGGDTAELFKTAAREAYERFRPQAMIVGASCTAELIQDDPGGLAAALNLPIPVVPLELPAYQRKENWGASETFYQLVRALCTPLIPPPGTKRERAAGQRARCNVLGPTALGFRHRDDLREVLDMLRRLDCDINVVAPMDATPADLQRLGDADFNVVIYPEIAAQTATWLARSFGQATVKTVPIGVQATREFIAEVSALTGADPAPLLNDPRSRAPWYSKSVDSTYLTGKRVFIFGDATHVARGTVAHLVRAKHQFLRGTPAHGHLHPSEQPRLVLTQAVAFRQAHHQAQRTAARDDGRLMHRVALRIIDGTQRVASFVIRGHPLLSVAHHQAAALRTHHHLVLGMLKLGHGDNTLRKTRCQQGCLVHEVRQIGTREARRAAGDHLGIDVAG